MMKMKGGFDWKVLDVLLSGTWMVGGAGEEGEEVSGA